MLLSQSASLLIGDRDHLLPPGTDAVAIAHDGDNLLVGLVLGASLVQEDEPLLPVLPGRGLDGIIADPGDLLRTDDLFHSGTFVFDCFSVLRVRNAAAASAAAAWGPIR